MRLVVRSFKLTPFEEETDVLKIRLYAQSDEQWREMEVDVNTRESNGGRLLEKMLEVAGNQLVTWLAREGEAGCYRFVNAEAPGVSITLGEGSVEGVETLLALKPSHLIRVRLVRFEEPEKYHVVYEFKPSRESMVYEGFITVKNPELRYDLILVDTAEDTRIILPHEMVLPQLKLGEKRTRRTKRRRKTKSSKAGKRKKSKSKSGKKRKSRRRRR
ncbi:hypothetical protein Desmu_0853 [Desulfurococcus mucosus DSM 2162]|uniref:Uncharacterized protein n=1 Tax=Desulfurococcus mucosus (strain ATCC 35584 / DSM 2162 / JCM 9187 / O7/1) TaxID=765177 RepID=E8R9I1_DESM0|nr:hypothetical protein Desmu_0853 [Desulfurococcus mucosus DSM 2162]